MTRVSIYARDPAGLVRIGAVAFPPGSGSLGRQFTLDPPGCVPDGVASAIRSQVQAGVNSGDLDWWYWRKEK
jgi:hypothetical protein